MKKLFLFLFLPIVIYAQYSINDSDLVSTTYQRVFDKNIISSYLNSGNENRKIAALLSIGNSGDTAFVSSVINCSLATNKDLIPFTLGQLGYSFNSSKFVLENIERKNSKYSRRSLFDALGKTGSLELYRKIINEYLTGNFNNFDGIALSIANFNAREIKFNKDTLDLIFYKELSNYQTNSQRYLDALYSLYRIGGAVNTKHLLIDGLKYFLISDPNDIHPITTKILQYELGCLRKINYFPQDFKLLKELSGNKSWFIREEASKALCYYPFRNKEDINEYINMLNDINSNVSRQAAISLSEIKIDSILHSDFKSRLKGLIKKNSLADNTRGEIFLSYVKLFPSGFPLEISSYNKYIRSEFIYRAYGNLSSDKNVLDSLCGKFNFGDSINRITILEQLIKFQESFRTDKNLKDILLSSLSSDSPALISISADALSLDVIQSNKTKIKNIISAQVNKYLDDGNFQESIMSLLELSNKIDSSYYELILNKIEKSNLYSLKKFAAGKKGIRFSAVKDKDNFNIFWKYAFKFRYAVVTTVKGKFEFEFLPELAPVTVGSFCYLAGKKFFNGLNFHRVVPGFVIQGGDPLGTGWGGPGYEIISEFSDIQFDTGIVGMASAGKDTEGSQWFVMQGYFPHLNGRYTVFGKVIKGIETVDKTDQYDKILSIKLLTNK